jgi:hypothetical protein
MGDIYLAGELIPADHLTDFKLVMGREDTAFKIVISVRAAFTNTQIAACVIGSIVSVIANGVTYTGTVTGFGCREAYSVCQIDEAVVGN